MLSVVVVRVVGIDPVALWPDQAALTAEVGPSSSVASAAVVAGAAAGDAWRAHRSQRPSVIVRALGSCVVVAVTSRWRLPRRRRLGARVRSGRFVLDKVDVPWAGASLW